MTPSGTGSEIDRKRSTTNRVSRSSSALIAQTHHSHHSHRSGKRRSSGSKSSRISSRAIEYQTLAADDQKPRRSNRNSFQPLQPKRSATAKPYKPPKHKSSAQGRGHAHARAHSTKQYGIVSRKSRDGSELPEHPTLAHKRQTQHLSSQLHELEQRLSHMCEARAPPPGKAKPSLSARIRQSLERIPLTTDTTYGESSADSPDFESDDYDSPGWEEVHPLTTLRRVNSSQGSSPLARYSATSTRSHSRGSFARKSPQRGSSSVTISSSGTRGVSRQSSAFSSSSSIGQLPPFGSQHEQIWSGHDAVDRWTLGNISPPRTPYAHQPTNDESRLTKQVSLPAFTQHTTVSSISSASKLRQLSLPNFEDDLAADVAFCSDGPPLVVTRIVATPRKDVATRTDEFSYPSAMITKYMPAQGIIPPSSAFNRRMSELARAEEHSISSEKWGWAKRFAQRSQQQHQQPHTRGIRRGKKHR